MMRYARNGIFTEQEMVRLKHARVCIVGCGGLGGYILEMMTRVGVGHLRVIDGDCFSSSNLNRQILSREDNMGQAKVHAAKERVQEINKEVEIDCIADYLDEQNAETMLEGHDLVMDALDSIASRYVLQKTCEALEIPLVHGAIAGWYGQVAVIFPGDRLLDLVYKSPFDGVQPSGIETKLGNPSFSPATIASIQVSEGLKVLLQRGTVLRKKLLYIDLLDNEFHIINL